MSLLWWMLALLACSDTSGLEPVPGTTLRIGENAQRDDMELRLRIFRTREECENFYVSAEDLDRCVPNIDRATGQVRLGFQLQIDDLPYELPVRTEHIRVLHNGSPVPHDEGSFRVQVVPHDPVRSGQLFIVVIDGSGSMQETGGMKLSRIERVRKALLQREVVDGFFPEEGGTGVVLMTFGSGDPQFVGEPGIIESKRGYRQAVKSMQLSGGYTHLYHAIDYASSDLLEKGKVGKYLRQHDDVQPTVIVLTDGFNNEAASDTCGDNARRLTRLLENLESLQDKPLSIRPQIYTVGLGRGLQGKAWIERSVSPTKTKVGARALCGNFKDNRIDGGLEMDFIDRASLEWVAAHGGGFAYVRRDARGLGEAFQKAAATRYRWYELRYQVDPIYLRRNFDTTISLMAFSQAESSILVQPSAWLDGPSGVPASTEELRGWMEKAPYRYSTSLITTLLGGLAALVFLGAAVFNIFRIATGRRSPMRPPGVGKK